jgi:hypothetical protein
VALLVLAHVDARHGVLVVEEDLAERFRQFGLTDTGGAEEDEAADRALLIAHARTVAAHRIGHRAHGFVLTDHTFVQFVLQLQELGAFGFQHAGDGHAGPAAHHGGDLLHVHFLLDHLAIGLQGNSSPWLGAEQFLLGLLDAAVADLGHLAEVTFALVLRSLVLQVLDLVLGAVDALHQCALTFPAGLEAVPLSAELGDVLVQVSSFNRSFSRLMASRSISSCMMRRSISSSSSGLELISMRSLLAASSIRSMALSGRNRSAM